MDSSCNILSRLYNRVIVFDLETTGFDFKQDDIIDFGAVVLKPTEHGLEKVEEINELVHTYQTLSPKIVELTGIDQSMVEKGISHQSLAEMFERLFTPGTLVVAYNLQFDISFVHYFMKRYVSDFEFQCDVLDLLTVFKDTYDYPHRLENALEAYDIPLENAHRAFDDAVGTAKLLEVLLERENCHEYINHIGYHNKYGLKGVRFDHVEYHPQSYLKGSLRQKLKKT